MSICVRSYRKKVAEQVGEEVEHDICKDVNEEIHKEDGDAVRLFYEPNAKRYFHASVVMSYDEEAMQPEVKDSNLKNLIYDWNSILRDPERERIANI